MPVTVTCPAHPTNLTCFGCSVQHFPLTSRVLGVVSAKEKRRSMPAGSTSSSPMTGSDHHSTSPSHYLYLLHRQGLLSVPKREARDTDARAPSGDTGSTRSSVSETSGMSGSSTRTYVNEASMLIIETVENGVQRHYLVPVSLQQRNRWRKRGTKLHVFCGHTFVARHVSSSQNCAVCQRAFSRRPGKQGYQCRDCALTTHKPCHVCTEVQCPSSSVNDMDLSGEKFHWMQVEWLLSVARRPRRLSSTSLFLSHDEGRGRKLSKKQSLGRTPCNSDKEQKVVRVQEKRDIFGFWPTRKKSKPSEGKLKISRTDNKDGTIMNKESCMERKRNVNEYSYEGFARDSTSLKMHSKHALKKSDDENSHHNSRDTLQRFSALFHVPRPSSEGQFKRSAKSDSEAYQNPKLTRAINSASNEGRNNKPRGRSLSFRHWKNVTSYGGRSCDRTLAPTSGTKMPLIADANACKDSSLEGIATNGVNHVKNTGRKSLFLCRWKNNRFCDRLENGCTGGDSYAVANFGKSENQVTILSQCEDDSGSLLCRVGRNKVQNGSL
ncbi:Protein kinase C-like phorbol ester/diacylglycerol-binding domain [Trinorchestia longiramus]|nr:Protein kinase C-like phorbol ester/diacylglycerol-binding domain [Trinorchestia longiramus]